jgi:hypothetical protein
VGEPKSIKHAWPNLSQKPTNQAFNASEKPFQREKKFYPEIKEKPYLFLLMKYFQTHPYKICHLWLNWEVYWLKGNHKLDFSISLSHSNHSYK